MNKLLPFVALGAFSWTGTTFAQDADASAASAEKQLEDELDLFWGHRREVKVVQKRSVEKDGRLELTVFGSVIPNDDFIIYTPLGGRVGYHFSEAFAVELSGAYALDFQTDLAEFLESETGVGVNRATILETIDWYANASLLWSPFYGKINFLGHKLAHFETYLGLGFGIFHTTESEPTEPEGNPAFKPCGNTVLGFRWFINDLINIRTEYRHFFFQKFEGGVSMPVELSLGVSFMVL